MYWEACLNCSGGQSTARKSKRLHGRFDTLNAHHSPQQPTRGQSTFSAAFGTHAAHAGIGQDATFQKKRQCHRIDTVYLPDRAAGTPQSRLGESRDEQCSHVQDLAEVTGMPSSKPPSLNAFAANHPLTRGKFIKSYPRLLRLFFRESALASILYVSCRDRSQLNRAPRRCVGAFMTMPFCRCRHEGATCAALPRPRLPSGSLPPTNDQLSHLFRHDAVCGARLRTPRVPPSVNEAAARFVQPTTTRNYKGDFRPPRPLHPCCPLSATAAADRQPRGCWRRPGLHTRRAGMPHPPSSTGNDHESKQSASRSSHCQQA